jgi:hypothetical protein
MGPKSQQEDFFQHSICRQIEHLWRPNLCPEEARHVQPVSAALTLTLYLIIYSIALWYLRPTAMAPGKKKLHSALKIARDV